MAASPLSTDMPSWTAALIALALSGSLLAGAGCNRSVPRQAPQGVVRFEVVLEESGAELGEGTLLPFAGEEEGSRSFTLAARALDAKGEVVTDYQGPAHLKAVPSTLVSSDEVDFTQGEAGGVPVTLYRAFGDVRIWIEDAGTDESPGTWATGVSPAIHFSLPTVAEMQSTTDSHSSPLNGANVSLRLSDRQMLVTGITQDGFYATDVAAKNLDFASVFAFNFSRPDDIEVGDRVVEFNGNVYEYLGYTEVQYPSWKVEDTKISLPAPIRIDKGLCSEDLLELERYEAAWVEVGTLESAFEDGDLAETCASYKEYGQWPARLTGASCAKLTVVNQYTIPDLAFESCLADPPTLPEKVTLTGLRGHLRQNQYADYSEWILDVDGCDSLLSKEDRLRFCPDEEVALRTSLHYSGPRPAPKRFYREHPDCSTVWYPLHEDEGSP